MAVEISHVYSWFRHEFGGGVVHFLKKIILIKKIFSPLGITRGRERDQKSENVCECKCSCVSLCECVTRARHFKFVIFVQLYCQFLDSYFLSQVDLATLPRQRLKVLF